jgi:hypothetical protein
LQAIPPLDARGEAFLGELVPREEKTARLVVRLFVPPGNVSLGFQVRDGRQILAGREDRPVVRSGLRLEPLLRPTEFVPGATLPYRLKNDTPQPLETVEVAADSGVRIEGEGHLTIGTLEPYGERLLLVAPDAEGRVRLIAQSHAVGLVEEDARLARAADPFPVERLTLSPSTPGAETVVSMKTRAPIGLLVFHPALKDAADAVRRFAVPAGEQRLTVPLDPGVRDPVARWFAVPFVEEGTRVVVGPLAESHGTTPFAWRAAARFYAATGDQIGVGPLPPRVGEATKFWVSWKLEPTTADLSGLSIRSRLPAGVRLTGREALPDGGTLREEDGSVVWTLDYLPATSQGANVSFEVELTPTADMRGKVVPLVGETSAGATEVRSQTKLDWRGDALDTNLAGDEKAQGKGEVR